MIQNRKAWVQYLTAIVIDEAYLRVSVCMGTKRKASCRSSPRSHSPDSKKHDRGQKMQRNSPTGTRIQSDSKPSPQGDRTHATIRHGFPKAPDQAARNCHRTSTQTLSVGGALCRICCLETTDSTQRKFSPPTDFESGGRSVGQRSQISHQCRPRRPRGSASACKSSRPRCKYYLSVETCYHWDHSCNSVGPPSVGPSYNCISSSSSEHCI